MERRRPNALIEVLMLLAGSADLGKVFDSMVVSGSAFDTRLTWQLATVFHATGKVTVPAEQLDQISINYATEIEASGALATAAWVLLHLDDAAPRGQAVRSLLERNAEEVAHGNGQEDADTMLQTLTEALRIPARMVYQVRALYAAGNGDAAAQTLSLLLAGDVEAAHTVVCTTVGPQAVIEQDYDTLSSLLSHFEKLSQRPEAWKRGGQVYADFVRLVRGQGRERNVDALAQKLRKGLAGTESGAGAKRSLEERVAVREMKRIVEEVEAEGGEGEEVDMGGMSTGAAGGEGSKMLEVYRRAMGVVV